VRILFLGDLVGRSGRDAVIERLPELRRQLRTDMVIVNGENAAGGFGITRKICDALFAAGVDAITGGNHSWDQREALAFIDGEPRLLRPLNYPAGTPGRGAHVYAVPGERKVLVINVMGHLFMEPLDEPFACVERALAKHRLGATVDAIVLDYHAEATSEKMAVGHVVDGRVSLCVGTHTHVPTADALVLPGGTAYQSDVGMCGDYDRRDRRPHRTGQAGGPLAPRWPPQRKPAGFLSAPPTPPSRRPKFAILTAYSTANPLSSGHKCGRLPASPPHYVDQSNQGV
jgi:metallophosphoesterase (TIGR00282 family)